MQTSEICCFPLFPFLISLKVQCVGFGGIYVKLQITTKQNTSHLTPAPWWLLNMELKKEEKALCRAIICFVRPAMETWRCNMSDSDSCLCM